MRIFTGTRLLLLAAGIIGAGVFVWYLWVQPQPGGRVYAGSVLIGTETWPGYLPLYVARDKGFFADEGVDVQLKRYVSLKELSADYVGGKLDGRANVTSDAVREVSAGVDQRIVAVIDHSSGADAIVSRAAITEIGMLRGKRVAYEPGTLEEFFLSWALSQVDLTLKDIVTVAGDPQASAAHLRAGEVDAAVSHVPFISDMERGGANHVLLSSANTNGLITDVLTFHKQFVTEQPETVEAIVHAYFRAVEYWKAHPAESEALLATEFGITPEEIHEQMAGIEMLDLAANHELMSICEPWACWWHGTAKRRWWQRTPWSTRVTFRLRLKRRRWLRFWPRTRTVQACS